MKNDCDACDLKSTSLSYKYGNQTMSSIEFERKSQIPRPILKVPGDYFTKDAIK